MAAADGVTVTFKLAATVTTTCAGLLTQVPFPPVTLYVVVAVGVAITVAPVLAFNVDDGVQV
jgi:hypothetical protein